MAERVVYLLETVEIDEHDDDRSCRMRTQPQSLGDAVAEQGSVRKAGQEVVEALVLDESPGCEADGARRKDEASVDCGPQDRVTLAGRVIEH